MGSFKSGRHFKQIQAIVDAQVRIKFYIHQDLCHPIPTNCRLLAMAEVVWRGLNRDRQLHD